MLKAKFLHSRSNPVRVAAFCFNNLKKAQVLHTDIPSSVDKILQDEMDVVSCRVLGYLLLGVVRIYSKKVEYVLDECNEVLIKINKFVINTEDFASVETLRMSFTIPDRLELDAFELDVLEDADGLHIAPREEITLKEVVYKTEGFGLLSQEKFEEFDVGENTCSFDHDIVENVRLSHLLNMMDIEVFPQNSPIDLLESRDIFQSSIFLQKEPMNFDSVLIVEGLAKESVSLSGLDQQIIEDQTVKDIAPCEDEMHEESSRISQVESIDISMFSGREKEHVLSVEAFNESHQVDTDQSSTKETSSSLCKMNQEIIGVHEARSFQESIEKPQDEKAQDVKVFPQNSPIDLLESRDIFQSSIFSHKEPMNFDSVLIIEGPEKESVNLSGQDQQIIEDRTVKDIVPCEGEMLEESSRISQEESMDISMFSGREKEHVLSVEAFNESHQVDTDQSFAKETSSSLCKMNQEIIGVHEARSYQENIEKPQDEKSHKKECVSHGNSSVAKEIHEELIEGSVEKHDNKGKLKFQEKVSLEDERLSVIPPKSKNLDVTPQSNFEGDLVRRPKRGVTIPEMLLISTPAVRERPHFSRKRKVVVDEMAVLPNKELRKSICDANDLVSNRRKSHRTLLTVYRESLISSLPNRFYEPLLPCYSSELQLLFSKKKMKIPDSFQIVESLGNLDVSESQTVGNPEHIATAPLIPPQCPDVPESQASASPEHIATATLIPPQCPDVSESQASASPEHIATAPLIRPQCPDVSESQASASPEHLATAPLIPPQCPDVSKSRAAVSPEHIATPPCLEIKGRSVEHPEQTKIQSLDNLEPSSPHESIEIEQSSERNEVLNLTDEEINSSGTEISELLAGWSNRTRKVASYLHQSFLHPRKQREEDVVNFSQVLRGQARKECANLFYEILVLKTTGYVDVKQNKAYGDIAISKLPKLDQTF